MNLPNARRLVQTGRISKQEPPAPTADPEFRAVYLTILSILDDEEKQAAAGGTTEGTLETLLTERAEKKKRRRKRESLVGALNFPGVWA